MHNVYLLPSIQQPSKRYIGLTTNLKNRREARNCAQSPHTSKFEPWQRITYRAFEDEEQARRFESDLKAGSGLAFAKRHFWK